MESVARIAVDLDPRLVALAAAVCLLACTTYVNMLARAEASRGGGRAAWLTGAAAAFGSGAWAAHFIAMIAMHTTLQPSFAVAPTIGALGLAIAGSAVASLARLQPPPRGWSPLSGRIFAGALLGGTVAAMHYIGMSALHRVGMLTYERPLVVVSLVWGIALAAVGMASTVPGRRAVASISLMAAIGGLHFIGVVAMRLIPWVPCDTTADLLPSDGLAIVIGAASLVILLLSLAGTAVDAHLAQLAVEQARRLRQFTEATFEGILFCRNGIVADVNSAFAQLCGRDPGTIIGRRLEELFMPDAAFVLQPVSRGLLTEAVEAGLVQSGVAPRPVELLCRTLPQNGEPMTVIAVRDISERKAAADRIAQLAHFDELTGCPNRVQFRNRLTQALAMAEHAGQSLAVLCCGLDRFKEMNDVLGHSIGDQVLIEVANRLRTRLRETDTLARLGGDEFAVIQPQLGRPGNAAALAERIIACLAEPIEIGARQMHIGISIGIALYPQDASTAETLLRTADLALYRGKQAERGTFHFYAPRMDAELRQRHALEQDLAQALGRGELAVHYQPLFDTARRRLVGHEALVRWRHPQHGPIAPSLFVPLAEQCGMIAPIGEYVLHTACAAAAAARHPHRIAVNLSPVQVRTTDLPRIVADTLNQTGLAAHRLELEITEGVLIEDAEHTLRVLRALKQQGVRIVLDDFGTGYSSLSYLRRFPFDKLKIDRSFMQGLGEDGDSDALVRSILALGHSLHLEVTAEGVETETQLRVLRQYGCDQVQGFLLGRPMPTLDSVMETLVTDAA